MKRKTERKKKKKNNNNITINVPMWWAEGDEQECRVWWLAGALVVVRSHKGEGVAEKKFKAVGR